MLYTCKGLLNNCGACLLMRIFATSDLHVDYRVNAQWVSEISEADFQEDVLILAGDISNTAAQMEICFNALARRFKSVLYVPGNHDLWVSREGEDKSSFEKFHDVGLLARNSGASLEPFYQDQLAIMPLLGWYDYSFGEPGAKLKMAWADYRACRWPDDMDDQAVTQSFTQMNEPVVRPSGRTVISFSHFLPRIDVMPHQISAKHHFIYPVLGTDLLDDQLRRAGSTLHIYGHSHVNQRITLDGVTYINNAYGYPKETRISAKRLLCIYQDGKILGQSS